MFGKIYLSSRPRLIAYASVFIIQSMFSSTFAIGDISVEKFFPVSFQQPLDMALFPEPIQGEKLFAVAEKTGRIYLTSAEGKFFGKKVLLMDLRDRVCSSGYEEGLLGIAFDPQFRINKNAYIFYTRCNPKVSRISRIKLSYKIADNGIKDNGPVFNFTEEIILTIERPYANHNGGCLKFGPDGYLYIGIGDGGSGGDPHNNAQNLNSLLGKILRIDVSPATGYKSPADNPFVNSGRAEIYAYGLRNPWRFSFDGAGSLIVGDVGQNAYEEVTVVKKGGNHGWRLMEGFHCFNPPTGCNKGNLVMPVYEYDHGQGRSITGGYYYQSGRVSKLKGKYIFGDYVSGNVWYLDSTTEVRKKAALVTSSVEGISSFATDDQGEVYIISLQDGFIYRFMEK